MTGRLHSGRDESDDAKFELSDPRCHSASKFGSRLLLRHPSTSSDASYIERPTEPMPAAKTRFGAYAGWLGWYSSSRYVVGMAQAPEGPVKPSVWTDLADEYVGSHPLYLLALVGWWPLII